MTNEQRIELGVLRAMFGNDGTAPLTRRARSSFRSLARQLSTSEGAIRYHYDKFEASGFIREIRLIPNPALVGAPQVCIIGGTKPPATITEVIEQLGLIESCTLAHRLRPNRFMAVFRYTDAESLSRHVRLASRISRDPNPIFGVIPYPPCQITLGERDWDVMRAFYLDARRSFRSAAAELGLSPRTVRKRLGAILAGRAAFLFPALDPTALKGRLMAALVVQYESASDPSAEAELATLLRDSAWHGLHLVDPESRKLVISAYSMLISAGDNCRGLLERARGMESVKAASLEVSESILVRYEPYTEDLKKAAVATPG